jgi:hypothetical protein
LKTIHKCSDVDLAMWEKKFTDEGKVDPELIRSIIKKYRCSDIKIFPANATSYDIDLFIEEIEKTGIFIFP